jgi:GDP-mannose 6-dehydrogenase
MRILVWGLGYVGTVSAACFAELGHEVIGVEPNQAKVDAINRGHAAIKEPSLHELVSKAVKDGRLRATANGQDLVAQTDASLVCVGTPNSADGSPQLDYVEAVARDIGRGLQKCSHFHVVCLRSTVFPGTSRNLLVQILEKESGRKAGEDFGLVMNPEFLRESSAVKDFANPPYTIIGELNQRSGQVIEQLYHGVEAPVKHVALEEAEFLKITNNVFHALKVGFGNEIGRLCDHLGIDSHKVMGLVCADTKLNISPAYLMPGFAFGGSCLPKDLRFVTYNARRLGVEVPILDAILPSNSAQVNMVRVKIQQIGSKKVGVFGLSFKSGTDDLRESPIISLIRDLWQDEVDVLVHDPDVNPEEMLGSNLAYLERQLPQIGKILCSDLQELINHSEVIVVSQKRPEYLEALKHACHPLVVLDLVRLGDDLESYNFITYRGVSW